MEIIKKSHSRYNFISFRFVFYRYNWKSTIFQKYKCWRRLVIADIPLTAKWFWLRYFWLQRDRSYLWYYGRFWTNEGWVSQTWYAAYYYIYVFFFKWLNIFVILSYRHKDLIRFCTKSYKWRTWMVSKIN